MQHHSSSLNPSETANEMVESIKTLVENCEQLAKQAYANYNPLVERIIATSNKDVEYICYNLDFMLDFCFDHRMLLLYRRLCRYLTGIDLQVALIYVEAYRDMWDEEGNMFD